MKHQPLEVSAYSLIKLFSNLSLVLVHIELVKVFRLRLFYANRAFTSKLAICYVLVLLLCLLVFIFLLVSIPRVLWDRLASLPWMIATSLWTVWVVVVVQEGIDITYKGLLALIIASYFHTGNSFYFSKF